MVGRFVREHCVATFEQVGVFTVTSPYSRRSGKHGAKIQKQGGNVVTYFCTPQGHVLHFVVGPVSPYHFLASVRWSHEVYQRLIEQEESGLTFEERRRWMSVEHEEQLAQDKDVLGKVTKWLSGAAGVQHDAGPRKDPVKKTFYDALNSLKASVGDVGHQLLKDRPLPLLQEIEAPVFELLAGQAFSRRAYQLQERVLGNVKNSRPTLLMVAHLTRVHWHSGWDEAEAARRSEPDVNQFLPKHSRVQSHLHAFGAEVLSSGELTMVVAALDQPPIKLPYGTRIKFVILDRQGEIVSVLTDRHPVGVLARMLEKYSADKKDETSQATITETSQRSSKQLARSELRLAEALLLKRPAKARDRLKKIVAEYPDTETAANALWLLAHGK